MHIVRRSAILSRVADFQPRLIRLVAPAGYGKTIVAQQIADRFTYCATCDFLGATTPLDVAKRLLTGLAPWLGNEGAQLLMGAASSENDLQTWMRLTGSAWESRAGPALLILENVEVASDRPELLEPLTPLFRRALDDKVLCVCSREHVALRPGRATPPDATMTFGFDELRFSEREID